MHGSTYLLYLIVLHLVVCAGGWAPTLLPHNGSLASEASNSDLPEQAALTVFHPRKGPDPRPSSTTLSLPSKSSTPSSTPASSSPTKSTPIIAGALAGGVVVLACALTIALIHRRRRRRPRAFKREIDPIGSPAEPHALPDPFMAYPQSSNFGPGVPQQNPPGTSVPVQAAAGPGVPRITITAEDGTTGRPLSLASNLDHRFSRYSDAKPLGLMMSNPSTDSDPPSAPFVELQQMHPVEVNQDRIAALQSQAIVSASDIGQVAELQRQINRLSRENERLRHTGIDAPPAYDSTR